MNNGLSKQEIIKLIIIVAVLLGILLFSIFTKNNNSNNGSINTNITIEDLFEPIKDNYTLRIEKEIENSISIIEYNTDGVLKLYNLENEENGYLLYKGKTYYVESKGPKIKEINNKPSYIEDNYTNIDFIKSITKYCEIENKQKNSFDCKISIKDYIDNYNVFFNKEYSYDGEEIIVFNFRNGSIINNIKVDYTKVNEIINKSGNIKYNIRIKNVNTNDFSNLLNLLKK